MNVPLGFIPFVALLKGEEVLLLPSAPEEVRVSDC